jgi:glutamyl-tRNA synthetase
MWLDPAGERLAKRNAAQTVAGLRGEGERPEAVIANMAASLGWNVPKEISLTELLDENFVLP